MEKSAPYASTPIPLSLSSTVGLKYRTLNCMECGKEFFERAGDQSFYVGDKTAPEEAHINSEGLYKAICGNCSQQYTITLSVELPASSSIPLYMQPQSFYIAVEPVKQLRNTYCLECGKAFYSISDRIKQVVDNLIPLEMIDMLKLGPMESRCKFQRCQQRWFIRV